MGVIYVGSAGLGFFRGVAQHEKAIDQICDSVAYSVDSEWGCVGKSCCNLAEGDKRSCKIGNGWESFERYDPLPIF